MKTKFTEGPWTVADYKTMNSENHVIRSPEHGPDDPHPVVASVHKRPGYKSNAYLISAAPDADRIVRHLAEFLEGGNTVSGDSLMPDDDYDGATEDQTIADAIRAYLAKVDGGKP